jgi:ubiquitin-protein ligase
MEEDKVPTVGVTARPLENNMFIWHANIKGPAETSYEGGVFHLQLEIPESFPHQPPTVTLLTPLPHPNVFGQRICLDMLQPARGKQSLGWSSGYTIQSILIQLQSFLFEKNYNTDVNDK